MSNNLYSNILNNYLFVGLYKLLQKINNNPECFSTNVSKEKSVNGNKITNGFTSYNGYCVYGYYTGTGYNCGKNNIFIKDADSEFINIEPIDPVDMCAFIHDVKIYSDIRFYSILKANHNLGQNLMKAIKANIFNKCLLNTISLIGNLLITPIFWLYLKYSFKPIKFSEGVYSKVKEYQTKLDKIR